MTKLEKKLIELGFTQGLISTYKWWKNYNDMVNFELLLKYNRIDYWDIERVFETNGNIVELQQELNNLQKDLEILKGCEENDK